jgi:hypothetical protein
MGWLGHRDSKMIRYYYHIHEETAQRHISRLRLLDEAGGADAAGEVSKFEPEAPKKKTKRTNK